MESLYERVGISRQGFHQYRQRQHLEAELESLIVERVQHHRETHRRMGARPLYWMMQNNQADGELLAYIGRDRFEEILLDNALRVSPICIFHKTTYAGAFRFPNLVQGVEVRQINHIWISDLTYYRLLEDWAYLTFILDLYSRRCIGYSLARDRSTEQTTLPALKMALKARGRADYEQELMFHSDGGGQYYDQEFLDLLRSYHIRSSMAEGVYENPHMERFHSTAKNDYLIPWGVNSFGQLQKALPRFVDIYNNVRPHESLRYQTPAGFEQRIQDMPLEQRPAMLFKKIS